MKLLENKIPPPVITLIFALIMWRISFFGTAIILNETVLSIVIVVLLAFGASFMLSALLVFKQVETTINPLQPDAASSLVCSGVFQISRNPMYVGMVLFLLAWGFYLTSISGFIGVLGFVLYMNRFQIEPEERALSRLFGEDYESYCTKVRRWL